MMNTVYIESIYMIKYMLHIVFHNKINNKANLRDLIAATGLVILLELDSNR